MTIYRSRMVAIAAAAIAVAVALSSCSGSTGGGTASKGDFTVGVVALDATQITANHERKAAEAAMHKLGWKTVEVNSNGNPADAITAMQNLVQRKVNAIVVQTYTADQLTAGLAAANAADIPVFSSSGGAAGDGMAGAVELVGAAPVNDALIASLKGKKKVELLELRYTPGAPCLVRAQDLDAKLKALPNVDVTREEVTIPGGQQSAQESTAAWLQRFPADPNTDMVIWPCFSEAALGAVAAEQQLGRGPYPLYTWDISAPAVQALKDGTMTSVLWIQIDQTGALLAKLIKDWKDTGAAKWKQTTLHAPSVLLTPNNIEKYLAKNPDLGS